MKLRLYVEICSACNLKCKYCFEKDYMPQFLPKEKLFRFFDKFRDVIDDVVITGGEPTLHPEFDAIIRYLACQVQVVLTTNGTYYDSTMLRRLLSELPNLHIQFSLDAIDQEYVDALCGLGTFEAVISAIGQLREYSMRLSISSTLLHQSTADLLSIYEFASKKGISCYFPGILPYGGLANNWDSLMPSLTEYLKLEETIIDLLGSDSLVQLSSNKVDTILSHYLALEQEGQVVKIDALGHLLSCPATDYSYESSRLGDIEEIPNISSLEEKISNHRFCYSANMLDEECDSCPVEMYCHRVFCGNCIHMQSNNIDAVRFICQTYKHHYLNLDKAYRDLGRSFNESN